MQSFRDTADETAGWSSIGDRHSSASVFAHASVQWTEEACGVGARLSAARIDNAAVSCACASDRLAVVVCTLLIVARLLHVWLHEARCSLL